MKRCGLVITVVLLAMMLSGCSGSADTFVMKRYTADEDAIRAINVDVRDRRIVVSPSEDAQVHIDYWESDTEVYRLSLADDQTLTMTADNRKGWSDYIGRQSSTDSRTISLRIPNGALSTLTVSTTNEDIQITSLAVEDTITFVPK